MINPVSNYYYPQNAYDYYTPRVNNSGYKTPDSNVYTSTLPQDTYQTTMPDFVCNAPPPSNQTHFLKKLIIGGVILSLAGGAFSVLVLLLGKKLVGSAIPKLLGGVTQSIKSVAGTAANITTGTFNCCIKPLFTELGGFLKYLTHKSRQTVA